MGTTYTQELITNIINGSMEFLALGFLLLSIYWLYLNRKNFKWRLLKKSESTKLYFKKVKTMLLGLLLVVLSFAIVNTFLSFIPEELAETGESNIGLISVLIFVLAGFAYSFSAFFDWLKYFSRVLVCGGFLYMLFSVLQ